MKSSYRIHSPSINNNLALQKYQFDIFQWQDYNIGNIERMRLQLYSQNKQSKCQWPIEWIFVIHNGYSFTGKNIIFSKPRICFPPLGRIMLNRIMKTDRYIDINSEPRSLPITREYGDSSDAKKTFESHISSFNILNKQTNA
jgi:hypothetical protein